MAAERGINREKTDARAERRDAFEKIVKDYTGLVYRTAFAIVKDPAEADEVVQSTFIKAYRKMGDFRGESKLGTWLYRIASNQAKNRLRDRFRHQGPRPEDIPLSSDPDPAGAIDQARRRRALWAALEDLPEVQRQVARLRLAEDMSFAEVGIALGITENNAKVNFHHAVKKLKERLGS